MTTPTNPCRTCRHYDGRNHPFGTTHGRCRWIDTHGDAVPWWTLFGGHYTVDGGHTGCGVWEGREVRA